MYKMGLIKTYATRSGQKIRYWDYFGKTIKLTGFFEFVVVLFGILLSLLLQRFVKQIKLWKM